MADNFHMKNSYFVLNKEIKRKNLKFFEKWVCVFILFLKDRIRTILLRDFLIGSRFVLFAVLQLSRLYSICE